MVTYSEKIKDLQVKIDLDGNLDDYETYFELGKTLFDLGIYRKALEYFDIALEIFPESEDAKFMKCYTKLKLASYA